MKKLFLSLIAVTLCMGFSHAQNDNDVLAKIGNETITKGDFIKTYQKNNLISESSEKDLREYLDLFVNFRLKVQEAQSLKLDTADSFQKELASYKAQSAQQYLIDTDVSDQLLDEAFERSKTQVRASHILIRCNAAAMPKDTAIAYQKIMDIRNKIVKGLNFNEAAALYSEDESARDYVNPQNQRLELGNRGELGYFSVMEMIYPFESGAYNTPVGEVSMPVRSQFGYHLIYVQDKMPALAKIYLSQIFIADSMATRKAPSAEIQAKLKEIETKFHNGTATFEQLVAEYSEDAASKAHNGAMEPFCPNKRPGNYVSAVIRLKSNEISEPVATNLGWHILRLDSTFGATVNEESRYLLKNRLARDIRSRKSKEALIEKLKKEYSYDESGKKAAMKFFKKNIDPHYFQSTSQSIDNIKGIEKLKPMCTFADQKLTAVQFARFVTRFQGVSIKGTIENFLNGMYPNFVNENIIRYESTRLEDKYPDYKALVKEFHDGMLLYEINSQKVWNAAIKDSVGLEAFYETIKTQYPVDQPNDSIQYKPMNDIRAIVVSKYQDYLEQQWMNELKAKYPVFIDKKVFQSILKK